MQQKLTKYTQVILKAGVNLQTNQTLVISSPLECAPFTRILSEAAYREGARDVVINWVDELSAKIRYIHGPDELFDEFPEWRRDFYLTYLRKNAAFISISASDPELLKDVASDRIVRTQKASAAALKEYREKTMNHEVSWCVVSIPTASWAAKVFPHATSNEAIDLLWDAIFQSVRVTASDPVTEWMAHKNRLSQYSDFLNTKSFKYLHYTNSVGTDLTVELPPGHIWTGGADTNAQGIDFIANMPTEEVFTLPLKTGVNGTVVSAKPLVYNGNLIDQFSLTFKDGKVIASSAAKGYDMLEKLLHTDDGASYLGEVALVPFDSPISNSGILFYNTLFDENASCHFAFGKAYPTCLKNGASLSQEQLAANGVNDSLIHVDFMIGTVDLEITGITAAGEKIPVFANGNFVSI